MSPSIPILFALLLALISGSTEGGQRTDPVALLRQTLRYWRKIYNTYHEEVTLGYCWADYLLEISDELSANLSATGDRPNTIAGATKSQRNPFPENVMADATRLRETQGKHLRAKRSRATVRSIISQSVKDPNHRHRNISRWKIISQPKRWMINNKAIQDIIIANNAKEKSETDGRKNIIPVTDAYVQKRTSLRVVNSTPNPKDDDKIGFGFLRDFEEDMRRKVLRPVTSSSHHGSSVEGVLGPRSFSLKVSRGRRRRSLGVHRFPFRRYPSSRESNSTVIELLSEAELENLRARKDPEGYRLSLNNVGYLSTPSSHSQFRRVNMKAERRTGVVKLMNSEGNSSRGSTKTINSKMPRWRPEELSRDSLLSPDREATTTDFLESRESGRQAVKKNPLRYEAGGGGRKKRHYRQPREGRNVLSPPKTTHPEEEKGCFLPIFGRSYQKQILYGNRKSLTVAKILEETSQHNNDIRMARNGLPGVRKFTRDCEDNGNWMNRPAQNSMSNVSLDLEIQDLRSPVQLPSLVSNIRAFIIGVLRTLGMFVQVGRQIMNIVESNALLVCTKEYLWIKIIRWIDT